MVAEERRHFGTKAIVGRALGTAQAAQAGTLGRPVRWRLNRAGGYATPDGASGALGDYRVPLRPMLDAYRYLAECPRARRADRDWVYVIQPDGRVFRQGVAPWNRSAPLALAPGATIYVPLPERAAQAVDTTLNHDLADFLATQLLPGPGAVP